MSTFGTGVGIVSASGWYRLNRGSSPLDNASAAQLSAPGRCQADKEICCVAANRKRHLRGELPPFVLTSHC